MFPPVLLVDLWNVIEGFRENGLNGLDPYSIITVPKLGINIGISD